MHSDGFDLLTISLARAGGLPLFIERMSEHERERRAHQAGRWPSEAAVHEMERQARRARRTSSLRRGLTRATGRLLSAAGRRLSSYGARLGGPAGGRLQGCG